jgi:hypothetical protein
VDENGFDGASEAGGGGGAGIGFGGGGGIGFDRTILNAGASVDVSNGVVYVNGGVFFARGTAAVARLFQDAWTLAAQVNRTSTL